MGRIKTRGETYSEKTRTRIVGPVGKCPTLRAFSVIINVKRCTVVSAYRPHSTRYIRSFFGTRKMVFHWRSAIPEKGIRSHEEILYSRSTLNDTNRRTRKSPIPKLTRPRMIYRPSHYWKLSLTFRDVSLSRHTAHQ